MSTTAGPLDANITNDVSAVLQEVHQLVGVLGGLTLDVGADASVAAASLTGGSSHDEDQAPWTAIRQELEAKQVQAREALDELTEALEDARNRLLAEVEEARNALSAHIEVHEEHHVRQTELASERHEGMEEVANAVRDWEERLADTFSEGDAALQDYRANIETSRNATQDQAAAVLQGIEASRRHAEHEFDELRNEVTQQATGWSSHVTNLEGLVSGFTQQLLSGVEHRVSEQVQAVVDRAVAEVERLFDELVARILGDSDDLRNVRSTIDPMFREIDGMIPELSDGTARGRQAIEVEQERLDRDA